MAKQKFVFDPQNLNYKQVNKGLKYKFVKSIVWIGSSLLVGLTIIVLYSVLFDTPRERELRQENISLSEDFEILNERYVRIDTVLKELSYIDENIYRTIFETDPVGDFDSLRSGQREMLILLQQENEIIASSSADNIHSLMEDVRGISYSYTQLKNYLLENEKLAASVPAIQPILNKDLTRLASGFGDRMHPFYKIVKFHTGIDFTAPSGTEVFATADGIIERLDRTGRGNGNTIVINHENGYKTYYSHLSRFSVRQGTKVKRGNVIGLVGNTGLSVGPHLHYEVHLNDTPVNPVNYFFNELSSAQYDRMIEMSIKSGQSFD
ncbi:MAG: M23 family metallopeptidase [Bacteroidales bacterium]|nr:M23 family metallopeptidase [Bacteroidales bacterium]